MRDKLNNNPIAQVAVVAILLGAAAFFLLGSGGGDSPSTTATTTTPTTTTPTTTTPTTAPATGAAPVTTATATTAGVTGASASGVSAAAAAAAVPVPPLPGAVKRAYDSGRTVVLLIVRGGGIDDALVAPVVRRLKGVSGVAIFIAPAERIARYGAITLGVDVDRVPALVVVRPRALSGGTPQATVSYGFQSPAAIVQAVIDASYNGPSETYHPG